MPKRKTFKCYLCDLESPLKRKGLEVGSGKFIHTICKLCSRKNYTIHEDNYFEEHNKMLNAKPSKEYDQEEIILRQVEFMNLAKKMLEKAKEKAK